MAQKINFSNIAKANPVDKTVSEINPGAANMDSYEDNLKYLKNDYPEKILFGIEESAILLGQSYESIRGRINSGQIRFKSFGNRKMIHITELARLITEGF